MKPASNSVYSRRLEGDYKNEIIKIINFWNELSVALLDCSFTSGISGSVRPPTVIIPFRFHCWEQREGWELFGPVKIWLDSFSRGGILIFEDKSNRLIRI